MSDAPENRMRISRTLAVLATLCAATSAMAQVTLYEWDGWRGATFSANWPVYNLDGYGFNDRAASVIVERGRWELCEDANFAGRCVTLRPGQYPNLGAMGLDRRVSSLRPVGSRPVSEYQPAPPPAYPYYPRYGETLYQADVVHVRAVVGPPEQRCWVERDQYRGYDERNLGGAIVGGIIGGVLGHQIGGGRGRDVATAIGAVGGAAIGSNAAGRPGYSQDVRRCETVPGTGQPTYWDVTYMFRGREYRAQLSFPPGPTITVNGRGEPRV